MQGGVQEQNFLEPLSISAAEMMKKMDDCDTVPVGYMLCCCTVRRQWLFLQYINNNLITDSNAIYFTIDGYRSME